MAEIRQPGDPGHKIEHDTALMFFWVRECETGHPRNQDKILVGNV